MVGVEGASRPPWVRQRRVWRPGTPLDKGVRRSDIDWSQVPVPDHWAPGSIGALRDALDGYVRSGEVAGPGVRRLSAALSRAERHLDAGRTGRATAALRDFLRHIERPGRSDTVADAARAALRHRAATVIAMLS